MGSCCGKGSNKRRVGVTDENSDQGSKKSNQKNEDKEDAQPAGTFKKAKSKKEDNNEVKRQKMLEAAEKRLQEQKDKGFKSNSEYAVALKMKQKAQEQQSKEDPTDNAPLLQWKM